MKAMRTLEDLDLTSLRGARVLVRVDFNVPLSGGEVLDAARLKAALPTLRELATAGARVVLMSHLGRPKGEPRAEYSLRPVARALGALLGTDVRFVEDCVGAAAHQAVDQLDTGQFCLLENLRFYPGESANDPGFATEIATLADAYVNDAFGTAHRAHASVVGVPELLSRRAAGRLLVAEIDALGRLLGEPERPFAAIVGGAKIDTKVDTVRNLLPRIDLLILGGGMANTFLVARGFDVADSLVELDRVVTAQEILDAAAARSVEVLLPSEVVVTDDLDHAERIQTVAADAVPAGTRVVDLGARACRAIAQALADCRTVLWNGPMGVFETPPFDKGTVATATAVADCAGFTVIGGGETVAAAGRAGVLDRIGHVSTGGGASLEFLAGKPLPGITVLENNS